MFFKLPAQNTRLACCPFVRIFFIVSFTLIYDSFGATLKYEELSELVRKKNGAVEAADQSIQANESRLGHYTRSFLPHLDAFGGAEHFRTGPYPTETQPYGGVELSLNLFRGGQDLLEEQHRGAQLTGVKADREKIYREELGSVRAQYWELVFQREWRQILEEMSKQGEQGAKAATRRKSRGLIPNTDVLAFELFRQQLKEQIESAEHEEQLIQISLRPRLGLDEKATLETSLVIPHDHDEGLLTPGVELASHPELEALNSKTESQTILAKQNGRWWLPAIDAYGTYSLYTLRERFYPELRDRYDVAFGIRFRMHLFDGFQSPRETESGYQSAHASELLAGYRKKTLTSDITLVREEMKHIHELIHSAVTFLEKAQKVLSQSLNEYDRGVRTTQDILSVTDRMLAFQKLHLERRRDYQQSKVKLMSLLGK